MIVTLDGKKAAGKTTQAEALRSLLNIERVLVWDTSSLFRHIAQLFNSHNPLNIRLFSILQAYHTIPKSCIVEGLWLPVINCRKHPHLDFDSTIDWFRTSLRLHSEPNLSVYLDISEDERLKRFARRESNNVGRVEITGTLKEDKYLPVWHYIEDRVPYFHIIDANQPEEVVTESILSLLRKTQ